VNRTSALAVPHSRSGKNDYEMRIELALPQSRTPAVEKNEYEMRIELLLLQSRSGINDYEMRIELVLSQSRTPAVEKINMK